MAENARKRIGDYEIVRELGHGGTTPPAPAATPGAQQEGCAVLEPRKPERRGRFIGWILGAGIVILVAVFGGTQVLEKLDAFLGRR